MLVKLICSFSSSIINDLQSQNPAVEMAYFYFDSRDGQADFQLQNKLIRCLISQFADMHQKGVPLELANLYKNSKSQQPQDASLENILDNILSQFPHAYIVIDALDECTNRNKVATWLSKIMKNVTKNIHILITSRPLPDMNNTLGRLSTSSVNIEERAVNSDIVQYLQSQIVKFEIFDDKIKAQIKTALEQKAEGSYVFF